MYNSFYLVCQEAKHYLGTAFVSAVNVCTSLSGWLQASRGSLDFDVVPESE